MIHNDTFREMALSFPGTEEKPHFDRSAFKVTDRWIFATLHEKSRSANIRLSLDEQLIYCEYGKDRVYPVPNKWGEKGWTTFELDAVPVELVLDALESAYNAARSDKK